MNGASDAEEEEGQTAEPGRSLVLTGNGAGLSLADRVAYRLHRLMLRTPLHRLRLAGKPPLRLLAVPKDPLPGDRAVGESLLAGHFLHEGSAIPTETIDFAAIGRPADFDDHLQSFAWLRDLAAAAPRERGAPIAERLARRWLDQCGERIAGPEWRPEIWGRRLLFWTSYAPFILSSRDTAYRTAMLRMVARGARHLDRTAQRALPGLPRLTAWAGVVTSALLIQSGPARRTASEAGLLRALAGGVHDDGGLISRAPHEQLRFVETLAQLRSVYIAARNGVPDWLAETLEAAAAVLLASSLGDERLASFQGGNPGSRRRLLAAAEAAGTEIRPARAVRGWGYQHLRAKNLVLVFDAAPPPRAFGGHASTLAFELSVGGERLIVNCGGAGGATGAISPELAQALRSSAAFSTLVLGDRNSTSVLEDGSLGRGVEQVEVGRDESTGTLRVEASHDGYARRFGLLHERRLHLDAQGTSLVGEDRLYEAEGRRRRIDAIEFAIRFHLAPSIQVTVTADGRGALLRMPGNITWQFRCRGGLAGTEDSLWIDGEARPQPTLQLTVTGESPGEGMTIGWEYRRIG